ncbi:tyrosine-type recombinase/integrase [Streptantibioticus rubrisoli]|uniref:Tyrosine-type recombinase/integrase n=1 Tax=Streptantibioticus rubrisoli TaxID=1387313 RepID=A0ABT1PJW0_9ACTN|nr:tyrosine-type recombinase/integrase [Streptantibioticus rubrisoli]MCQ4045652.1 tyrosine-type recombinase/integrase [Streptantibioticus rubrisoli]
MDEPALWRLMKRLAGKASLPKALIADLHPHSLRHSAITGALEADGSLRDVQAMAGHADSRTTERYDRMRGRLDKSLVYALLPRWPSRRPSRSGNMPHFVSPVLTKCLGRITEP